MNIQKKKPKIAIIIPVHDSEKYLDSCIISVLNQTYTNLEIVVVDDDSKDGSRDLIREWIKKDQRIKLVETSNHNAALTRRDGIIETTAEYICFVDSDDIISNNYIQLLYSALTDSRCDVAAAKIMSFSNENDITKTVSNSKGLTSISYDTANYFFNNYQWNSSGDHIAQSINAKLFKRYLLEKIDYTVLKTSILEDNYVVPQILVALKEQKIALIDEIIYYYRKNNESTMSNALFNNVDIDNIEYNYVNFFDKTIDYIVNLYKSNSIDVKLLADTLKKDVFKDLASSAIISIGIINEQLSKSEDIRKRQQKALEDKESTLADYYNSKAYKLVRVLQKIKNIIKI